MKPVKEKMSGFMEFIRTQGVVGLAIGFILGDKVKVLVNALVTDLINPFVGVMLGSGGSLQDAKLQIGMVSILWGHFVSVMIDFVIVAAVVYFVIKGLGFEKLDKKKE